MTTNPGTEATKAATAVAKKLNAAKKAERHTVTVTTELYDQLEKAAKARMVGVSMLAGALIEYGLEHLADPELFDD